MHAKFSMSKTLMASASRFDFNNRTLLDSTHFLHIALHYYYYHDLSPYFLDSAMQSFPLPDNLGTFATAIILHQTNFCAKTHQHRPNPAR